MTKRAPAATPTPIPAFAPLLKPPDASALESGSDTNVGVEVVDGAGALIEPVVILLVRALEESSLVSLRVMLKGWLVDNG